jgi:hypothetical protein
VLFPAVRFDLLSEYFDQCQLYVLLKDLFDVPTTIVISLLQDLAVLIT